MQAPHTIPQGSYAIALGRDAGEALMQKDYKRAKAIWQRLDAMYDTPGRVVPGTFPSLAAFVEAYAERQDQFAKFACGECFPETANKPLQNALGAIALAMQVARYGEQALEGAELKPTIEWGAKAYRAAGFELQAQQLEAVLEKPRQHASFAAAVAATQSTNTLQK